MEFDGITKTLSVAIPLNEVDANDDGSYTINIGVSDTGDGVYDSALWVSNFTGTPFTSSGLFLNEGVEEGETYVAPSDVPVRITLEPVISHKQQARPDLVAE